VLSCLRVLRGVAQEYRVRNPAQSAQPPSAMSSMPPCAPNGRGCPGAWQPDWDSEPELSASGRHFRGAAELLVADERRSRASAEDAPIKGK
jgi:hypothetical protein